MKERMAHIIRENFPGPKSKTILENREKYIARGIGNSTYVVAEEAKGALIKDVDGNVFIDFAAGIGVQNVGHCNERVVEAIKDQTEKLIHPCFHVTLYEPYVALGKKLSEIVPINGVAKVMFANSGAEAVENAIKLARRYTGKTGILCMERAFHGRTFMAMTLTSKVKPYKNGFGPFMNDTYRMPTPYYYRENGHMTEEECDELSIRKIEDMFVTQLAADDIAAWIVEPIQGEGGFIKLSSSYLRKVRDLCDKYGIVLIIDEIQTGFARTGTMFALEASGVKADIMTLSKGIGAGVPISAVVGKKEIMDSANPGEIGGTYGGSPLGCRAALEVIEIIESENLCEKAYKMGEYIKKRMEEIQDDFEVIGDIRGSGAMMAIEFVKDKKSKLPNKDIVKPILDYALNKGVIFISAGVYGNVIRFLPPLVMTEEQQEYGLDVLIEAIKQYA
ncbi:MAG: 4-aminobutyrate--2-oxoglutarate transaminase [Firmicutes bacterium HGW-Firmicutes-7]|nr:MAG: 4-aminobutyrate--2-oxoglutarate transaminase [Firmicutes bacterium HGW-Firmicutes-7]